MFHLDQSLVEAGRGGAVQPIELVDLRSGRGPGPCRPLPHGGDEVWDAPAADALEVYVSALPFLLFPGQLDERTLDVAVNDLRLAARTPLHLLLTGGVSWDTE